MSTQYRDLPAYGFYTWKAPVDTLAQLPTTNNSDGDVRVVTATDMIYVWDAATSTWNVLLSPPTGVSSLNGETGALTLTAGTGISITTPTASTIQISSSNTLSFIDSLVNISGNVSLVNDTATPGATSYYGTNSSSVLGYYSLPSALNGVYLRLDGTNSPSAAVDWGNQNLSDINTLSVNTSGTIGTNTSAGGGTHTGTLTVAGMTLGFLTSSTDYVSSSENLSALSGRSLYFTTYPNAFLGIPASGVAAGSVTVTPGYSNISTLAPQISITGAVNYGSGQAGTIAIQAGRNLSAGGGNGGLVQITPGRSQNSPGPTNSGQVIIYSNGVNGINYGSQYAAITVDGYANTILGPVGSAQDILLPTGAISGFLYLKSMNGVPSGTPSAIYTGSLPFTYDATDNVLYAYRGSSWTAITSAPGTFVTSVGLSLPASVFSVTNSPVTTNGTLTGSFQTQIANTVFAGPSSGSAATPTFRALTTTDVPDLSGTYVTQSEVGAASGVCPLNASSKIPATYLPNNILEYQGVWNPSTNTPALSDSSGTAGNVYWVSTAYAGPIPGLSNSSMVNFQVGDLVLYNGTQWELTTPAVGVQSVNGSQGVVTVNAINQLTGDVTAGPASGSQSQVATLTTVNSNTGSFGSSTAIPNFTVNAKGLITAAGTSAVVAPAGTLSGTTLNSTIVSSSLTSVGTISTGIWNGTTIAVANGGTGTTTAFTTGSIVFADGGGVYTQDNANLFYDAANAGLSVGSASVGTSLNSVNYNSRLKIHNQDATNLMEFTVGRNSNTATSGSLSSFLRSRGTEASPTLVQTGDMIHAKGFWAYDGSTYRQAAQLESDVTDPSPSSSSMAGNLKIMTTPVGSITPVVGLTVNSDQSTTFAGAVKYSTYVMSPSEYNAGNSSTTITVDLSKGSSQLISMTGNCTVTLSNAVAGGSYVLRCVNTSGSAYTITTTGSGTTTWMNSSSVAPAAIPATTGVLLVNIYASTSSSFFVSFVGNYLA